MPNGYLLTAGRYWRAAKRVGARHGLKASIIAVGAVVAAGTLHQTSYLPRTPLGQRIAASASDSAQPGDTAVSADSVSGGLDDGVAHSRVEYWVHKLTTSMSSDFEQVLSRKQKYDDMITAKLDARGMPRDLVYLAAIESEYKPTARSRVGAVGMWQFMAATARRFGLTVSGHNDERKDPAKQTDAALAYLDNLHDRFGSWYLAAAAYNSGEGTVLKALKRVTGRSTGTDADFFRIMPALPKETQDYVPKLIAASRVGNDPAQYGLSVNQSSDTATTQPAVEAKPTDAAPRRHASLVSRTRGAKHSAAKHSNTKHRSAAHRSTRRSTRAHRRA